MIASAATSTDGRRLDGETGEEGEEGSAGAGSTDTASTGAVSSGGGSLVIE
jgi:hypothetical protein